MKLGMNNMLVMAVIVPSALLLTTSFLSAANPVQAATPPSVLQQIIAGLRTQQRLARNIRVTASSNFSSLNKNGDGFHDAGMARLAATYTPTGRFRMRVRDVSGGYNILIGLDIPVMMTAYMAAYDGRVGTVYNIKAGNLGQVRPQGTGTISGRPPRLGLSEGRWTGWTFSVWGLPQLIDWDAAHNSPVYQRMTLLDFLEDPPRKCAISAHWASDRSGHRVAMLTIVWQSKDVISLDPTRNFSVVQDRQYFVAGRPPLPPGPPRWQSKPGTAFTVAGFWQPAPGIYYPKRVVDEFFAFRISKDQPVEKNTVDVTRVLVNDRNVNAASFVVHFPAGATVTDESTGQVIHIGGTVEQQAVEIKKAVAAARKEVSTQPAVKRGHQ